MSDNQSSRSISSSMWIVIVMSLIEAYLMYPFEGKGDFAEVGRFLVNALGSAVYLLKVLLIGSLMLAKNRAHVREARNRVIAAVSLATPLIVLLIHGIVTPKNAIERTLEAYEAAPVLGAYVLGLKF